MSLYLVGLTMISPTHDYAPVHAALKLLNAQKLSDRIWLCEAAEIKSAFVLPLLRQCLAKEDKMLVESAPAHMHFTLAVDKAE